MTEEYTPVHVPGGWRDQGDEDFRLQWIEWCKRELRPEEKADG